MLSRRIILASPLSLAAAAARAQARLATPAMTEGPFYPDAPAEFDNDLVRVKGEARAALGRPLHLTGQVWRMEAGAPRRVKDALVEIWQCDANQRYHHPAHTDGPPPDPGFQGYGRTTTGVDGAYQFRTIRPVAYDMPTWGRPMRRAPHIHFAVSLGGRRALTTQMFVQGEAMNERDMIFRRLGDSERRSVLVALSAGGPEPDALSARFDLTLV